ncbi:MAG: formate--tetrahydrofolate ligase, partial [Treponema sp.]|nr:formate--tetrahydrofolate ligase [Treponema sp.]
MSVQKLKPVPSDIDVAQAANVQPIAEIAGRYGIPAERLEMYGEYKAKVRLEFLRENAGTPKKAKYIDVTAITPTPLGEGKTTTTVGLTQGLGLLGRKAICAIRQPSMGPTFGIKGGAAGGGYSQIVPMADFNLHLTGDIHAVSAAHNLCSTALDARIYHEGRWSDAYFEKLGLRKLNFDPYEVWWRRVLDMNDRTLRKILVGVGGIENGPLRETGFDISVASEVMAILALAKDLRDLRERIGRIVLGLDKTGKQVTTEDLGVAGAMTILLKDALAPNIMQTLEEQLAFVHAGPFANIAHGNSSILADQVGVKVGDYLVTESGFGADMGFEKFVDIKCRASGIYPDAAVLVATVRALKMHGGGPKVVPGKPLAPEYKEENRELLKKGLVNLKAHLGILRRFGVPAVVAINAFPTDTEAEWDLIKEAALD